MSAISSFPNEVLAEIFFYMPPSDIVTNCRAVCKTWNKATDELSLWQKIATSVDIKIDSTAKAIEIAVKNCLLNRCIVISTETKLKEKFTSQFLNIPEGETRALCYRSVKDPEAIGFFIKTKNDELSDQFYSGKFKSLDEFEKLFSTLRGLTIMGEGEADYACEVKGSSDGFEGPQSKEIAKMVNLCHKFIGSEYFLSEGS